MRSPLNPARRLVSRVKWLDLAPYVSKVTAEFNPVDYRAMGLR
jgi:hypothetical protein